MFIIAILLISILCTTCVSLIALHVRNTVSNAHPAPSDSLLCSFPKAVSAGCVGVAVLGPALAFQRAQSHGLESLGHALWITILVVCLIGLVDTFAPWTRVTPRGVERFTPWSGYAVIAWTSFQEVQYLPNVMMLRATDQRGRRVHVSDFLEGRGWIAHFLLEQQPMMDAATREHLETMVHGLVGEVGRDLRWPVA